MRSIRLMAVLVLTAVCALGVAAQSNADENYKKFLNLTKSAPQAYIRGDAEQARSQAFELLEIAPSYRTDWNYGNAVHAAHLVIGRIAVDEGDLKTAKRRLLESVSEANMPYGFVPQPEMPWEQRPKPGTWKASPQMDTFGPDMTLAAELLKKGERQAVLQYLELCSKLWTMGGDHLTKWKKQIADGETPDFGANMRYFFGN